MRKELNKIKISAETNKFPKINFKNEYQTIQETSAKD